MSSDHALTTQQTSPTGHPEASKLTRLLRNVYEAESTYMGGTKLECYQELLVLFWKFLEENPISKFVYYSDSSSSFLLDNKLQDYFQKTLILNKDNVVVYVGSPTDQNSSLESDLKELINEEY